MEPARPAVSETGADAEEFVRFCYRRRRVGWPDLYDEMCAVATRGLFRGMGHAELSELGIGFSLFETPRLSTIVHQVVADEQARRVRLTAAARPERPALDIVPTPQLSSVDAGIAKPAESQPDAEPAPPRLAVAALTA